MQLFATNYNAHVMWVYKSLGKWLAEREIDFVLAQCKTEDEVIEKAQNADIYLAFKFPVTRRILASLPNLKLLMCSGSGYEFIDVDAATQHGVIVTNTANYNVEDVAEYALTLILAGVRRLPRLAALAHQGQWQVGAIVQPTHRFTAQTIGLVGFGKIGQSVARRLRALGFRVLAHDSFVPAEDVQSQDVAPVSLDSLLAESDLVSLHVPLNDQTHHLISHPQLQRMKSSAWLVNTSRGPVVDENALIAALQTGQIGGAALDVLEQEPPASSNPLFEMDNVIITGHAAGTSVEGIQAWQDEWRQIIDAFAAGHYPINVLNRQVQPRADLKQRSEGRA